jgi:MFS family permease
MPLSGVLMSRHGSQRVVRWFALACVFALLLVALAPSVIAVAGALFIFGGLIGGMDVAMNSNAVAVEKKLSQAIMSSSHGFWSLGGFVGGGVGGFAIQNFGYFYHAIGVTVFLALILAIAARHVVEDDQPAVQETKKPMRLPRTLGVYLVGLVALFAMIPEGAVLDWGALYLQRELGASISVASLAFSLFAGSMAVLRFAGDRVRNKFGSVTTMRVSSLIAAVGILVAGLAPWPWLAIAAFAFAGIGIANIVPIAFSAAGNQPGMASSTGMSVVTTIGYSGILLAPSAIGFAAEQIGFSWVFIILAAPLLVVCFSAKMMEAADFQPSRPLPGPEMI